MESSRPSEVTEFTPPPAEPPARSLFWRRFSPPNPFYLLSAACVVHGTGLSLNGAGEHPPAEIMLAIIGGYVLLMAAVAFLIVRLWNVWDDARSILLIQLLLFVELALVADSTLLDDPAAGAWLLVAGMAIAVAATEFLLWGLRLPLPAAYRIPYYLQLALLFLYPLRLLEPLRQGDEAAIQWSIFAFAVLGGASFLTLIPAVRRGAAALAGRNAPWSWPLYPWTVPVFLGFCLAIRSYTLCLAYDPATKLGLVAAIERMQSIFGAYFLIPFVFGAAALALEAALVRRRTGMRVLALALPLLSLVLAFPGRSGNAAYLQFVDRFTGALGSPLWVTLIVLTAYYTVAAARGLPGAARGSLLGLLAVACIEPRSVSLSDLVPDLQFVINPWLLWLLAGVAVAAGLRRRHSRFWVEAGAYVAAAAWQSGWFDGLTFSPLAIAVHVFAAAVIVIGALFADGFARWLREAGVVLLAAAATGMCVRAVDGIEPRWLPLAYLFAVMACGACLGWWLPHVRYLYAAVLSFLLAYATSFLHVYGFLDRTIRWAGLTSFTVGLALLHVGLLLSAAKGGGLRAVQARLREIAVRRR
jgi:hypothetical protein